MRISQNISYLTEWESKFLKSKQRKETDLVLLFAVFFLLGIKTREQSSLHLPKKNCIISTNQMGKEAVKKVNN